MSFRANVNVISNQIVNFARRFSLGFSLFASSADVLDVLFVLGVERLSSVLSLPVESSKCSRLLFLDVVFKLLALDAGGGFEIDGGPGDNGL
jgi:hypothetical protein